MSGRTHVLRRSIIIFEHITFVSTEQKPCGLFIRTNYLPCCLWSQMLSDESDGKAGPTSGLKGSHLGPTSLSWTLSSCQFRLDSLLSSSNFIPHNLMISNFVDLAWICSRLAASVSNRQEQSEASHCSVWKSRQTTCLGKPITGHMTHRTTLIRRGCDIVTCAQGCDPNIKRYKRQRCPCVSFTVFTC